MTIKRYIFFLQILNFIVILLSLIQQKCEKQTNTQLKLSSSKKTSLHIKIVHCHYDNRNINHCSKYGINHSTEACERFLFYTFASDKCVVRILYHMPYQFTMDWLLLVFLWNKSDKCYKNLYIMIIGLCFYCHSDIIRGK
jgi:hypothetical protein